MTIKQNKINFLSKYYLPLIYFMIQVMGKTRGLMDFRTDILVKVPVFLEQIESTLRGISTEQLEG